ncbi:hypothetical protein TEA_010920 [Camellia sinensis var. sinensis]|uniref:Protein kinase domain-containing protein n=1 Tax=Camellia sinensis var. sinensis TaxID=542762 RepID=A0A4S4EX11_CAMSN|nr:hypothetical protein TEA_010920 [Camellia sinensis var. sinensis]
MSGLSADDAISSVVIESCHCFSLAEIQSMTNNFNEELVIGMDGFGKVYKGFIDNGATTVAIKRLKADSNQGAEEFWNEVNMLSKLRHTHLVALIGQCSDCQEMILVYEYMAPGTLANHLYKQTTNILLDENYVAKISDFGFSKGSTSNSATRVSTKSKNEEVELEGYSLFNSKVYLVHRNNDLFNGGSISSEAIAIEVRDLTRVKNNSSIEVCNSSHTLIVLKNQSYLPKSMNNNFWVKSRVEVHCFSVDDFIFRIDVVRSFQLKVASRKGLSSGFGSVDLPPLLSLSFFFFSFNLINFFFAN